MATEATERLPSGPPAPPPAAREPSGGPIERPSRSRPSSWWLTGLVAAILCLVTFETKKAGLDLESMTTTEIALTLGAGVLWAGAAILAPARGGPIPGLWTFGLLLAFTMLSALSVVWSVQPDASWEDSGRMLAYTAVFGAALTLVRLTPGRWQAILEGVTLAAVIVCGYALLTKVFPASLAPSEHYARLEAPYGYWNAIGLTAAMGAIGCIWLGARRDGHPLVSALAYPAMGITLLVLVLAYSRGALAALAIGLLLWFCAVPLRLKGAAVLIVGALGAAAVTAWDFSRHALTADSVALGERTAAGHHLGLLLLGMVIVLALAGTIIGFQTGRRPPSPAARRRAGAILLASIALAVIAFAGALAHSHRGLTGSISHAVGDLTNPNSRTPPNTPNRLTAVASVRARYWKEALQVFAAHPALGVGANGYQTARLRYRTEPLEVRNAHGFVVQTLADLGLVGLLLALALLGCWMAAAGRATHPFSRSWTPWSAWRNLRTGGGEKPGWRHLELAYTDERMCLLTMLCVVVVFGAHSLVDWTWYVPGDACVALLCAGWLAGRGHLAGDPTAPPAHPAPATAAGGLHGGRPGWVRISLAAAAVVGVLLAAWSQWQPQRSEEARESALVLLPGDPPAAAAQAELAVRRDPLSPLAKLTLAEVEQVTAHPALARATLAQAVREQPSNPQTWFWLGRYDLLHDPSAAKTELEAAIYLNPQTMSPEALTPPLAQPEAIELHNDYIEALRATTPAAATSAAATTPAAAAAARLRTASALRVRAALLGPRRVRLPPARPPARSRTPRAAG